MALTLIRFHLEIVLLTLLPSWYQRDFVDEKTASQHAHYRRATQRYQAKRKLVRTLWTGTGVVIMAFPVPPLIVGGVLFSTCLSFAILDEGH